jgi:hypothetical protein
MAEITAMPDFTGASPGSNYAVQNSTVSLASDVAATRRVIAA